MPSLRNFLKRIVYGQRFSSNTYINFLRKKGVQIGENCIIYNPRGTIIDYQNPQMVTIGNNVRIADGVKILTHDYSLSVVAGVTGDVIGSVKPVTIGNNVFIGMSAIILNDVTIGNNVIVGAGSVVTHDCASNFVYAGNPARKICSIDELYVKRKSREKEDARRLAQTFYEKTGKLPSDNVLREYLMLFSDRSNEVPSELIKLMKDSGNYKKCISAFREEKPAFRNFDDFIKWCNLK